jgi:zinc metalloprotease ZmpB
MHVKRILLGVAVLALVTASAALATRPGSGTSTGSGLVFLPNPVADLQDQTLTDQKDSADAVPQAAYHTVALENLDGSGFLVGSWANIRSETGNPAYSPTNEFFYDRSQDEFEQVMAYHWVDRAQEYIQSLGFRTGGPLRPVNEESQDIRINQWGADNSFSWDKKDLLKFGKGGVDDAEDAEVILHEYGHAIQDSQQTPFGYGFSFEARSIGEGFADYWAYTVSSVIAPTPDPACIADWDAVSYTTITPTTPVHCLRRVDTNLTYDDFDTERSVHSNGRIWSRALSDIRAALGNFVADRIILEAQFGMRDPTMPQLAQKTVDTAALLHPGTQNAVKAAFVAREILEP